MAHRILLFTVTLLIFGMPLRVAAAERPTENCDGDPGHYEHTWATSNCSFLSNPHFPGDMACDASTRDCQTCIGCCNGRYDEDFACDCGFETGQGSGACLLFARHVQDTCRAGTCGGTFNCYNVDLQYRVPDPD